jgi:hypothetical protein
MEYSLRQQEDGANFATDFQLKKIQCQTTLLHQLLSTVIKDGNIRHFNPGHVLDLVHLTFLALDQWARVEMEVCSKREAVVAQGWDQQAKAVIATICSAFNHSYPLFLCLNFEKKKLPEHLKVCFIL